MLLQRIPQIAHSSVGQLMCVLNPQLVMRAATAPSALALPRTLATANPGAVSKSPLPAADRHQSSKENLAPPKRKAAPNAGSRW